MCAAIFTLSLPFLPLALSFSLAPPSPPPSSPFFFPLPSPPPNSPSHLPLFHSSLPLSPFPSSISLPFLLFPSSISLPFLPLFHSSPPLSLSLPFLSLSLPFLSLSPLSPPSFPQCAINGLSYSVSHLDISSEQQLTGRWSIFSVFSHQCWRQDSPGGLKQ